MNKKQIIQVIPANGWYALNKAEDGETILIPLVCWALVEDAQGRHAVQGIEGRKSTSFSQDKANFIGYRHKSRLSPDLASPQS